MNGIINVYKEKGFTSFDVCAKLRGILKQRKIGHTGTLDPDAEGVLPVCVGNATKLCDLLTDKDKEYEAVLRLGVTTDTEDMTGQILTTCEVSADEESVRACILSFIGTYDQIPPMYSAIKINGQKLYDLARKGQVVERKARRITIHSISILSMETNEKGAVTTAKFRVSCSKGTYIRTLCKDIGEKLGCGGAMDSLLRTKVSVFDIEQSLKLSEIEKIAADGLTDTILMQPDALFSHLPKAVATQESDKYLYNGNILSIHSVVLEDREEIETLHGQVLVYDSQKKFTGIFDYQPDEQRLKPVKMFL